MADVLIGGIGIAPRHCVIGLKDGSVDADLDVVNPVTAGIGCGGEGEGGPDGRADGGGQRREGEGGSLYELQNHLHPD
ncbi:hypothetical protein KIPB_013700, partial [Kipferlia bialata]|eukprot:g13700.t1